MLRQYFKSNGSTIRNLGVRIGRKKVFSISKGFRRHVYMSYKPNPNPQSHVRQNQMFKVHLSKNAMMFRSSLIIRTLYIFSSFYFSDVGIISTEEGRTNDYQ